MKRTILILIVLLAGQLSFSEAVVHVVERGDTVFSIARRYNVSADALQNANDITDPSRLSVGRRLVIPNSHKVERGETYYGIARRYGISVDRLLAANDRTESSILRAGDTLLIPAAPRQAGTASTDSAATTRAQRTPAASASVAPTVTLNGAAEMWPHPGKRSALEGKFPGVRIDGDRGDDVVAVAAGRVIYSGPHTSFGRVVFVQSPAGFIYIYGGNDELLVSVGDRVQVGSSIGTVGQSSAGASVFFTVWKDNRFVDPGRAPRG